jgi:DUF971 family protein
MRDATGVFNNATQELTCYDLPYDDTEQDGIWDWQYCTEMLPQVSGWMMLCTYSMPMACWQFH